MLSQVACELDGKCDDHFARIGSVYNPNRCTDKYVICNYIITQELYITEAV